MSPKKRYTFYITDELDQALKALKERDGMPEAEALRRGLTAFLVEKGVLVPGATQVASSQKGAAARGPKAASRRAGTRRKA
jgi:hypothetical protein